MTEYDVAGHLYYILIFIGMLLIAAKERLGWFFRFMGELGWIGLGFQMGMTSIWAWGIVFAAIDAYAFWKWSKSEIPITKSEG